VIFLSLSEKVRGAVLLAIFCAAVPANAATTHGATQQKADSNGPALAKETIASNTQGNIAELKRMLRDDKLVEMRTTYNGSYGTSLFFDPSEMTYYVVLFQEKTFWRAVKIEHKPRAEQVYANFVRQTVQLSDTEMRRTELQAQKAFLEQAIALSENQAEYLRVDLNVERAQREQVAQRQKIAQEEMRALEIEKRAAQLQLRELQQQVRQLERQTEAGLPSREGS